MNAAIAVPDNTAATFLVHFFRNGLADGRIRDRAIQGPRGRRYPPLARRDADEGQGAPAVACHRHGEGGLGVAPRPHRNYRLHGASHPPRLTVPVASGHISVARPPYVWQARRPGNLRLSIGFQ